MRGPAAVGGVAGGTPGESSPSTSRLLQPIETSRPEGYADQVCDAAQTPRPDLSPGELMKAMELVISRRGGLLPRELTYPPVQQSA